MIYKTDMNKYKDFFNTFWTTGLYVSVPYKTHNGNRMFDCQVRDRRLMEEVKDYLTRNGMEYRVHQIDYTKLFVTL